MGWVQHAMDEKQTEEEDTKERRGGEGVACYDAGSTTIINPLNCGEP